MQAEAVGIGEVSPAAKARPEARSRWPCRGFRADAATEARLPSCRAWKASTPSEEAY